MNFLFAKLLTPVFVMLAVAIAKEEGEGAWRVRELLDELNAG